MKKIFTYICTLLAAVGCSTDLGQDVVATYTAALEVSATNDTRVFDQDLKWSWSENDRITGLQVAGNLTPNTLTLNQNGKFFCEEFVYATQEAADFMFIYPASAYREDGTMCPVQNGLWTPVLVGTVSNTTVSQIATVTMEHRTAAMEVRVWESDKAARKNIVSATLTCSEDILFGNGTEAAVSGLNTDTVWFNIAPTSADAAFTLTLTDTEGEQHTASISGRPFVNGQRTIVNVAWKETVKPTASFTAYSSYNNKDNSLDGNTIYIENIVLNDSTTATLELYINGTKQTNLTVGGTATVANLPIGAYSVTVKLTDDSYTWTSEAATVYVTGVPCEANFLNSSYDGWTFSGGISFTTQSSYTVAKVSSTGAVISPEFGKNVSFGITVNAAGQSRNVDFSLFNSVLDKESYGNIYMTAGTKSSTGSTSSIYILSTYNSSGNPQSKCMEYIGAVSGVTVGPSSPCLVCYREQKLYDGYIYKIKVEYTK